MNGIPNGYEINVARKKNPDDKYGMHFCKIQLRSDILNDEVAEEKLQFFRELFGDDYHVSMTHWECHGYVKDGWS